MFSEISLHSDTNSIFDSISQKSRNQFLFKLEGAQISDSLQSAVWEAFGSYIRRQLKQGKCVQIPKFGKFTFTFHEANPDYIINDLSKAKDQRKPIFIVSKDFISGREMKTGTFTDAGITPYPSFAQTGKIQEIGLNMTEIAIEANTSKDNAKLCLQRVFREILCAVKDKQSLKMDIPSLGTLHIKSGICAVKFFDNIVEDLKIPIKRDSTGARKLTILSPTSVKSPFFPSPLRSNISTDNNEKPMLVDESASQYLKKVLDIDVGTIRTGTSQQAARKHLQTFDGAPREVGWLSPPRSALPTQRFDAQIFITRILLWIRNKQLSPTDAFYELVSEVFGIQSDSHSKLNFEDFGKVLKKFDFKLTGPNAKILFNAMDRNKDGFIDLNDWLSATAKEEAPTKLISNLIKTQGIASNKVLEAMGLNKECSFIDRKALHAALSKLGPNVQPQILADTVEKLLEGKDFMDVDKLMEMIQIQQDSENKDYNSMKNLLERVKSYLQQTQKQDKLYQTLREASQGRDTVFLRDFKHALVRLGMGLRTVEINKLARQYEVAGGKLVEYKRFYKDVEPPSNSGEEVCLKKIANKLEEYIKSKKWEPQILLRKVAGLSDVQLNSQNGRGGESSPERGGFNKVAISLFAFFLKNNIMDNEHAMKSEQIADRIDIDRDGFICKEDLETFMCRSDLFPKNQKLDTELASTQKLRLFPTKPLCEEDLQTVLRELRRILEIRKMTELEFYYKLDINDDGFLSIEEFCLGIEKMIPLPRAVSEGFFAYIDTFNVGFVDLPSFLKVIRQTSAVKEKKIIIEDNFDWPVKMVQQMRQYFESKGVSREEAFKIVDSDFDGNISKEDLKVFLLKIMNIPKEEVTGPRVERIFKLLDRFKRGCIQLDDFAKALDNQIQTSSSTNELTKVSQTLGTLTTIQTNRSTGNDDTPNLSLEWMTNAKQQIGLVLSRKFDSLRASFDSVSAHTSKILYKTFIKWVEDSNILQGFNLTTNLLLQFFAELDPHRKGYLTFNDWEVAFKNFDWNSQLVPEFKNIIYSSFSSPEAAFGFFCSKGERIKQYTFNTRAEFGQLSFSEALKSLLPNRYSQREVEFLWSKLSQGREKINYSLFSIFLEHRKFESSTEYYSSATSLRQRAQTSHDTGILSKSLVSLRGNSKKAEFSLDVFEKLKNNIRSAKHNIIELFQQVDITQSGKVSSLEFRNVLLKLGIGLKPGEINYLLDLANVEKDGSIDWKSFVNRIVVKYIIFSLQTYFKRETDVHLFQRYKDKIAKIKENIYMHMLTPKDAFLRYNTNGTGKLAFEEFVNFMNHLCSITKEEVPALSIIKDLFNFIDIKKDGIIDIHEWSQTFNKSSALSVREESSLDPKKQAVKLSKTLIEFNNVDWTNTKNYDDVMLVIGRNRKLLFNKFMDLEQRKVPITYEIAKSVIKEVLSNGGIKMDEKNWNILLKFAEIRGIIDYRKLLSVFKDRVQQASSIPRTKVLYL